MKIVREHINEKFAEKSDPVKDMGIGFNADYYINSRIKPHGFNNKDFWKFIPNELLYRHDNQEIINIIIDLIKHCDIETQKKYYNNWVNRFLYMRDKGPEWQDIRVKNMFK